MKASEVKKLLNCSYSSLHNYVRDGKLKVVRNDNHHQDYDNDSVYRLMERMGGRRNKDNISIYSNGKKYEFSMSSDIVLKVLNFMMDQIQDEIQKQ